MAWQRIKTGSVPSNSLVIVLVAAHELWLCWSHLICMWKHGMLALPPLLLLIMALARFIYSHFEILFPGILRGLVKSPQEQQLKLNDFCLKWLPLDPTQIKTGKFTNKILQLWYSIPFWVLRKGECLEDPWIIFKLWRLKIEFDFYLGLKLGRSRRSWTTIYL